MNPVILHGTIVHTPTKEVFDCHPDSYLISEDGKVTGIFQELPEKYKNVPVLDYGNSLILPGLCDMHVHAPQFVYRGLGIDLQLMEWLDRYAFPTEARFADLSYARIYYEAFADALAKNGTTRAVIFGTLHAPATELLMEILEKKKIGAYVGKINMDTLSPDYLCETPKQSLADTRKWIEDTKDRFHLVKPAVTPRFIPTCSTSVLEGLGKLAQEFDLPVHSHISEDLGEMSIVRDRYPQYDNDGDVYDHFGLLTSHTVMAHFIYPTRHEMELIKERGVTIAHCPQSNAQLSSGIAPVRRYLDHGMNVGLGTDVAGGANLSMFRCMADAVAVSKLRWRLVDEGLAPLTTQEALWLATAGGGSFFGRVGSLAAGYEFDALVLDDSAIRTPRDLDVWERLERYVYLAEEGGRIARKFVSGREVSLA